MKRWWEEINDIWQDDEIRWLAKPLLSIGWMFMALAIWIGGKSNGKTNI